MLGLLIGIIVTVFVGYYIFKGYKAQTVLFAGGLILMACAIIFNFAPIIAEDKSTGFVWFDLFEWIKNNFSSRASGLGLTIMAVAGFAKYMEHIGASTALVKITIAPIKKLNSPYIILAVGYLVGQLLNIFIPSASGLGVLLMVTMYPILVGAGVSPLAATAMIGTASCLDLGPASGNANLAATTGGVDVSLYFTQQQIPVGLLVSAGIAISHYLVQKHYDKKEGYDLDTVTVSTSEELDEKAPKFYAILPLLPLFLILAFSKLLISSIKMDVITAMLISVAIALLLEVIRYKGTKEVVGSIQVFFDGMGKQFATVVTLIVAGETFANGLTSVGAIDAIISGAQSAGLGANIMIIIMTAIISVTAIVMGSGNAPFFAFAALAPDTAAAVGINAIKILLPMQFAAGIARSISPITAVIVAVAGVANLDPFKVVKRTAIPMLVGLILTLVGTFIFL